MTDFIGMVQNNSYMFLTGPGVVKTVCHEDVTTEELGGAAMHSSRSGVCDFAGACGEDVIAWLRTLLSYMPQNNMETTPMVETNDPATRMVPELNSIIPDNMNAAYDMKQIILSTVDDGIFTEIKANFAKNIIVGFARYNGRSVGIIANNPMNLAGCLDIDSSKKGARFVRFCDCFNIPVVTFVDVPGFLPGTNQEFNAVILNGAKLLYAYCEATIPKITIITRKAYGGAYCVMSSKHIRGDINYAWPTAEVAVMGASGAVGVLHGRTAASMDDPQEFLDEKVAEYQDKFSNPYVAAGRGYIDDIIEPAETRMRIINALNATQDKRDTNPMKKHGNIPL
jgi:propionyl-CoA carboxylase beta chain